MFVIGMEVDFGTLKDKLNKTIVISHTGILFSFFLGIIVSYLIYEEYAAHQTAFLPFSLFIGIAMSITAFPVLARIIQERNMTRKPIGILTIASAANDDVTAWCLLAVVIAITKAGTLGGALYTIHHRHVCHRAPLPEENRRGILQQRGHQQDFRWFHFPDIGHLVRHYGSIRHTRPFWRFYGRGHYAF